MILLTSKAAEHTRNLRRTHPAHSLRDAHRLRAPRGVRATLLLLLLVAGCEAGAPPPDAEHLALLEVPAEHTAGEALFQQHCTSCHGQLALGTEQGPPLVHRVYRPLHHGDEAFQLAVSQGVRAHHWRYGDMPPVPGLTRDDVAAITGYIRWLQRAAGID